MSRFFRSIWFRGLMLAMVALALYALAGFWLAPRLIRSQATDYVRTELNQKLSLGEIRSNPFTFELDIRDVAIGDGGPPLVALKHAYVDFQASSLWHRAWTFRAITLEGPFARAIIRPDGSLNLADLIPKQTDDSPLPQVWVETLRVTGGQVNFADRSRRLKPEKQLSPIEFELRNFHTTAEGGGFKLSAASSEGERFEWSGRVSLQPIASDGHFKVSAFQARSAYEFLSEQLPFEMSGGRFDAAGDYRFSAGTSQGTRLEVSLPQASATDLGLRVRDGDRDWVTLPSVVLKDTRLSLQGHAISIASVSLNGLRAEAWLNADGTTNLSQLFSAPTVASSAASKTAASPKAPAAPATSSPSTKPADWTFTLAHLELQQGQVALEDRSVSPFAKFQLSPLSATADKLSLDLHKPVPIAVRATINGKTPLSLRGEVIPATLGASVAVTLGKLPVRDLLPYLPMLPTLQLRSGTVAADGEVKLAAIGEKAPEIRFSGSASVDDFTLVQRSDQHDLVRWGSMKLEGLDAQVGPLAVSMKRMHLRGLFAQVEIAPDQSINLVSVLEDPANQRAEASVALSRPVKSARDGAVPLRPAPPSKPGPQELPPVSIDEVILDEGTMSFADYSIQPNFRVRIDALRGSIRGVSTAPDSVTSIDLAGQVINRYSPVLIKGETMPFGFDQHTDITMKFSNIELPIFNPYSGRFAGYAIAKGKLTTELHYQIDQRKLTAGHHVILDQLEWGAATDSKEKVSLPIRLATSLLKDRHGVIDLSLPVTGTLDDPKFRIGPIVWQVLKNIMVKIVTAPFSFLGSLFEGAEDAQFVDFAPGSPALSEAARSSLSALSKGLSDRPALKIDIPVGIAPELDAMAIGQQRFEAALVSLKQGQPAYSSLPTEDKLDLLEELYKQQFGKKAELPEAIEPTEDASRKDRKAARTEAAIAWLEAQLKPRFQADAASLTGLGQARAKAVQESLLASGELDPARVFLAGDKALVAKDGAARMELGLE